MAFAITQTCCADATCVSVCPVNCIHPTPDEPDFGTTEMLYVDPRTCIDCGACADACPVDAIFPVDVLTDPVYSELNAAYYEGQPADNAWGEPTFPRSLPADVAPLRIAIVGTGPAAGYAAQALLRTTDAEVTMIDRLPVPGGLIRYGVAPDHPSTKKVGDNFAALYRHPRLSAHLNVEVGVDVTHEEVAAHHHAVVYAVGAAGHRALDVPGEDLPGSVAAGEFVGWYNGHPDVLADAVDLSSERVVVVGNGNVAVDIARLLVADPLALAATDIADHALAALRSSKVREVVLLGRRGPAEAAYTRPELLALLALPGVSVVVDDHPALRESLVHPKAALLADVPVERVDWSAPPPPGRRIVLRFQSSPLELTGSDVVESIRVTGAEIPTSLVIRSIGYRGDPVPGLPFDPITATVPHSFGRVVNAGDPMPGTYVVGWIKRGPSGGIGTNRTCSAETVDSLLTDAASRVLPVPVGTAKDFARLVRRRAPGSIGVREMRAIDSAEVRRGQESGRPRVKFVTVKELLKASRR